MARKPQPRQPARRVEDVLREIEKRVGPSGLLDIAANLGTGNAPAESAITPRPADPFAEKHGMVRQPSTANGGAAILDEIDNRFASNPGLTEPPQGPGRGPAKPGLLASASAVDGKPNIGNGYDAKPLAGLLGTGSPKVGGLLAPSAPPRPAPPHQRSPVAPVGHALDDLLFGGAAGDLSARRRTREEQQAAAAAHREAFAAAQGPQGFDPARYSARMAELGQAPDMAGLMNLEGMTDSQDVRGYRGRQERRGVTAGAVAPVLGMPQDQQPGALENVAEWLKRTEGYDLGAGADPRAVVGAGIGAGPYLDNERGDRALEEQRRSAMAGEQYRERDFGLRRDESQWERGFKQDRAEADDQYRLSALEIQRLGLEPNSTTEIMAEVLAKIRDPSIGEAGLNPGERALWENYKRQQQLGPFAGLPGYGGGAPANPYAGMPASAPATQPGPLQARPAPNTPRAALSGDGSAGNPARPQSQADLDRLPAGSYFLDPGDGQLYQK